ncbi:MAG: MOSC N-terminal beta barrel domain-containing protein [Pseudomonadota bacterium]
MNVKSLHIYPIKSSRGFSLDMARVEREGFEGDRRWVLINRDDRFISQRTHPDLAKLSLAITSSGLSLTFDGDQLEIDNPDGNLANFTVWNDEATGYLADDSVNDWFSDRLGEPLRLAFMGKGAGRDHESSATGEVLPVSYADGYPILIANEASLDALNDYLGSEEPDLPMARFRPNIVVEGAEAWAEDGWARVRIGDLEIDVIKPCTRCVMTTLNPMTGEDEGDAVMRAMIALRRSADKALKGVLFGMNAAPKNLREIRVGDRIEVLETRDPWPLVAPKH